MYVCMCVSILYIYIHSLHRYRERENEYDISYLLLYYKMVIKCYKISVNIPFFKPYLIPVLYPVALYPTFCSSASYCFRCSGVNGHL